MVTNEADNKQMELTGTKIIQKYRFMSKICINILSLVKFSVTFSVSERLSKVKL